MAPPPPKQRRLRTRGQSISYSHERCTNVRKNLILRGHGLWESSRRPAVPHGRGRGRTRTARPWPGRGVRVPDASPVTATPTGTSARSGRAAEPPRDPLANVRKKKHPVGRLLHDAGHLPETHIHRVTRSAPASVPCSLGMRGASRTRVALSDRRFARGLQQRSCCWRAHSPGLPWRSGRWAAGRQVLSYS